MTTETLLTTAKVFVSLLTDAQERTDRFFVPFLKKFHALQTELHPKRMQYNDFDPENMTFKEVSGTTFYFEGEEYYAFGEYTTPTAELPMAFVEDPKAYTAMIRKERAEFDARQKEKAEKEALERVARLEAQLEKARKEANL
jgi:hypothetical protein